MNKRAKELLKELGSLMLESTDEHPNGVPPSGHTRLKLNELQDLIASAVTMSTIENEWLTADAVTIGNAIVKEFFDAEMALGKPGADMSWQEVRGVYTKWFQMAADMLTPEGVAKRLAGLKARTEANIATPAANVAKAGLYDALMNKFSPN